MAIADSYRHGSRHGWIERERDRDILSFAKSGWESYSNKDLAPPLFLPGDDDLVESRHSATIQSSIPLGYTDRVARK